jgi:muconolactone delta-isomerase
MNDPREEPAVKTTILEDDAAAKRAAELWAREKKARRDLAPAYGGRTDLERTMGEWELQQCV